MFKLLNVVTVLALLAGCASNPVSLSEAAPIPADRQLLFASPSNGTVPIIITRDNGFVGSACASRVTINGKLAALVKAGEKATLNVPAGSVILGAEPDGVCGGGLVEIEAKIQGAESLLFRIAAGEGGIRLYRTSRR